MNTIAILNQAIRQDSQGRYCINDLHKASGGEKRHQPANWLRQQQTKELIAELTGTPQIRGVPKGTTGIPVVLAPVFVINGSTARGTYVVEELVFSYAMWISAAFHLQVVRAYAALVRPRQVQVQQPHADFLAVMAAKDQIIAAQAQTIAAQADAVAMSKRGMDAMQLAVELSRPKPKGPPKERLTDMDVREACAKRHQGKTVTQIAREMGLSPSCISQITRSVVMG
jgi:hypothetical protein